MKGVWYIKLDNMSGDERDILLLKRGPESTEKNCRFTDISIKLRQIFVYTGGVIVLFKWSLGGS